jgi:uncharacterized protein (TIGR02145 family)
MKTRKILAVILLVLAFAANAFSQSPGMAINTDGATPHASAMLDVSSTTKGFLPPRMTNAQKTAIASPVAGLLIWCSNCGTAGELQIYNGTTWTNFVGGTASAGKPDAPTIGTATVSGVSGTATVTFTQPASNGGAAIISYTATSSPGSLTATLSQAGSGTITFNGLTNGTAYTFTVTATNSVGVSLASTASNSVTPYTVPGAPTIGTATATDGQATVTFTAPASNGGSAITSYTATSIPGGFTGTISQAGSGTITVTGLTNGIAYTFTVKATNAAGASAASTRSNSVTPKAPQIIDGSGNIYQSVTIGTQTWLTTNLTTTKYNDGTAIPNVAGSATWKALLSGVYCDYSNAVLNSATYGKLYNYYAVDKNTATKVASNGGRNICPIGWHVPSDAEWTTLVNYLGGESEAHGKLKETGTVHWKTPNTGATNSSGFTALPGGAREGGVYFGIGLGGYWWSYTEANTFFVWSRCLTSNNLWVSNNSLDKNFGMSVRCLKD